MLLNRICSLRTHINILMRMQKIQNIRCGCRKNTNTSVYDIVRFLMYKHKHRKDTNDFKHKRPQCYICVLFQRLIQPLHAKGIQNNRQTDNANQCLFRIKFWYHKHADTQKDIRGNTHNQINQQKLMHHYRQFRTIIPHLCARPNSIHRNSQLCQHHNGACK